MNLKIIKECSEYIKESKGLPLIKFLPTIGSDTRKFKVRWKKNESTFDKLFNNVFRDHPELRQRCIFAYGKKAIDLLDDATDDSLDSFYVLPINGYKYIYSINVVDSSTSYKETFESFVNIMEEGRAIETFHEVLKYDYTSSNLAKGIMHGSEIILYGIPYYYAIRTSTVKNYSTLFSL